MLRLPCPDYAVQRVEDLDLEELHRQGVRGLLLDLDNTLTPWRGYEMTPACRRWLERACREFRVCLLSNALRRSRVAKIAESLGVPYVHGLGPWGKPGRGAYRRALRKIGADPGETIMVGDQLLVDVLGARRCGLRAALVEPIGSQEFFATKLTRRLGRCIERRLRRQGQWPGSGLGEAIAAEPGPAAESEASGS